METSNFFALISRLKYIDRWALMRSSRKENLSEHSLETAVIAHALCTIANVRYGEHLDADRAAAMGLFHDAGEIITGDMPTPVKYRDSGMRDSYHRVEDEARKQLLEQLPEDLRPSYAALLDEDSDPQLYRYVKAADKLSAYIKCLEEENAGSQDFRNAQKSTLETLQKMAETMPALQDFLQEFLPAYGHTLDELLQDGQ